MLLLVSLTRKISEIPASQMYRRCTERLTAAMPSTFRSALFLDCDCERLLVIQYGFSFARLLIPSATLFHRSPKAAQGGPLDNREVS